MANNFEFVDIPDLKEGLVRDPELESLDTYELVRCIIDCTEAGTNDLDRLNTECIFRGMMIQNNGIILGVGKKSNG